MVYVTRREHFSAAHRLYNPKFSDEENRRIFDKCSNPNWHGHNYELEVTVVGEPDPDTGMVIDLKKLKEIMNEYVIEKIDHKNINVEVEFMRGVIPTTENIAKKIWEILGPRIEGGTLYSIKLYESKNNFVEYRGK